MDQTLPRLFEVIAGRCRGRALLVDHDGSDLADVLRGRGLDVVEARAPSLGSVPTLDVLGGSLTLESRLAEGGFRTVVLRHALEQADDAGCAQLLAAAWRLVGAEGRLIAIVPNEDSAAGHPAVQRFDRRSLRRLLKALGRPQLLTEQPFRWLVMYVDKPRPGNARRVGRTRSERYEATARLCRGSVIELGCGEGRLSSAISKRGLDVVGVDRNRRRIARARDTYPELTFVESDILALPFGGSEFDTAVLAEVLEHVDESAGAAMLRAAWALVRPGGRLIVSVPNEDCVPHPHHVRQFTRHELVGVLEPFGRPALATEQPFKWLMAYVDKGADPG